MPDQLLIAIEEAVRLYAATEISYLEFWGAGLSVEDVLENLAAAAGDIAKQAIRFWEDSK